MIACARLSACVVSVFNMSSGEDTEVPYVNSCQEKNGDDEEDTVTTERVLKRKADRKEMWRGRKQQKIDRNVVKELKELKKEMKDMQMKYDDLYERYISDRKRLQWLERQEDEERKRKAAEKAKIEREMRIREEIRLKLRIEEEERIKMQKEKQEKRQHSLFSFNV